MYVGLHVPGWLYALGKPPDHALQDLGGDKFAYWVRAAGGEKMPIGEKNTFAYMYKVHLQDVCDVKSRG